MTTTTARADEAGRALKARHRAMWALGHYPALADEIIPDLGGRYDHGTVATVMDWEYLLLTARKRG